MENFLHSFNEKENFWKAYPEFKLITEFKDLWKNDNSRDKKDSSQIMWAVVFMVDPSKDNRFRQLTINKRKEELAKHIIGKVDFDWEEHQYLLDVYKDMCYTSSQKALDLWDKKMEERQAVILKTEYTLQNSKQFDDMLKGTQSLLKELEDARSLVFAEEKSKKRTRLESDTEKGLI